MGTKNNPGKFDCYQNAEPDEPMFVLLGRDPSASHLVRLWAYIRNEESEDENKLKEALGCADAMEQWAETFGKRERISRAESTLAEVLAEALLKRSRDDDRAIRECMINRACDWVCDWVRANGPHIPNAGQMRTDLLRMLDEDDKAVYGP